MNGQTFEEMMQQARNRREAESGSIQDMIAQARAKQDRELADWVGEITGVAPANRSTPQQNARPSREHQPHENLQEIVAKEIIKHNGIWHQHAEKQKAEVEEIKRQHNNEISTLKSQHDQAVSKLREEIAKKNTLLQEHQGKLKDYEQSHKAQLQQIEKNDQQIRELENNKRSLQKLNQDGILDNNSLKSSIQALQTQIELIQRQNLELSQVKIERDQLRQKVTKLENDLELQGEELEKVKNYNQSNMKKLLEMREKHLMDEPIKEKYNHYVHHIATCQACGDDFTSECFLVTLRCGHIAHEDCVRDWKESLGCDSREFTCPVITCKKEGVFY